MGTARTRSSTGLRLLDAQTRVAITGTPHHQDHLRWYAPAVGGPPSQVEVELLPAPIWSAGQTGWWGLEARIDGQRVGELIQPVAGWYRSQVEQLRRSGHHVGAEAHVVVGERGLLEVELYLPVADYPGVAQADPIITETTWPARGRVPLWMGVTAAALLLAMVAGVAVDRITRNDPVIATPAADTRLALAAQTPSPPAPVPTEPTPAPVPDPIAAVTTAPPSRAAAVAAKPRPKTVAKPVTAVSKPQPQPKSTATSSRTTSKPKPTSREPEPSEEPTEEPTTKPTTKPPTKPTEEPTTEPDPDPGAQPDQPAPDEPSAGED